MMPRFERFAHLYEAFELIQDRCVIHDQSMIWPDQQLWTLDNLHLLQDRFIDTPNFDQTLGFEEKLIEQLGEDKPLLWALIADVYFIFCLPPNKIHFETKLGYIQKIADRIPFTIPDFDDPIWKYLKHGFVNTSQRYNQKYRQFWLIINFFIALKESGNPQAIINDRKKYQKLLDEALLSFERADRASDMRQALLFFTFPDFYEPIISLEGKRKIIEAFWSKVGGKQPEDDDEALNAIRQALQNNSENPDEFIHFYDKPYVDEWRDQQQDTGVQKPIENEIKDQDNEVDQIIATIMRSIRFTKNIILYGPPGTGKTYYARKVAKEIIKEQLQLKIRSIFLKEIVGSIKVHELIALAMYQEGKQKKYSVKQIANSELLQSRYEYYPIKNERENIWGSLQRHSDPDSQNVNVSIRSDPALFDKNEKAEWFLTNEGIVFIEENLSDYVQKISQDPDQVTESDFVSWITFHQSFSYEEFVEGLRPVADEDNGSFTNIKVVPGVFRQACVRAAANPEQKFVLVIDEINRGSISRVFGELITLVEDDKRAGQLNEISVVLPYSKDTFKVPHNLFIIGTMNTADRSIALLDVALRRRFAFIEITADPGLLMDTSVGTGDESVNLGLLLEIINKKIIALLDRDHQIGHSYLLQVANHPEIARIRALEFAWNSQIIPLLEEYFYSQPDQLIEIVKPFIDTEIDLDVNRSMRLMRLEGDELLCALVELIQME
jgi:5-methylcytosine-specific restriction endonuclease McrBC GTP-binding regulatory subunit McrB